MWNLNAGDVVKMTVDCEDGEQREVEAEVEVNCSDLPEDHWGHSDKVKMETSSNPRVSMSVVLWNDGSVRVSPSMNANGRGKDGVVAEMEKVN